MKTRASSRNGVPYPPCGAAAGLLAVPVRTREQPKAEEEEMKLNITIDLDIETPAGNELGQVIPDLFKGLAGEYALLPEDVWGIIARHGIESTLSEDAGRPTGTIKIATSE